jgi:hypothetical protein
MYLLPTAAGNHSGWFRSTCVFIKNKFASWRKEGGRLYYAVVLYAGLKWDG